MMGVQTDTQTKNITFPHLPDAVYGLIASPAAAHEGIACLHPLTEQYYWQIVTPHGLLISWEIFKHQKNCE